MKNIDEFIEKWGPIVFKREGEMRSDLEALLAEKDREIEELKKEVERLKTNIGQIVLEGLKYRSQIPNPQEIAPRR